MRSTRRSTSPRIQILAVMIAALVPPSVRAQEPVDFARQVLPLLSDRCFVCHGPDSQQPELLRLDSYEGATRDLGGYRAVDPSDPSKSRLLVRIHHADDPMPPRDSGKTLTKQERELLTRWVKEGGRYSKHWSFVPPQKQQPSGSEGKNPIDAFVRARLREKGVGPSPSADRQTLARRVALVLTGLPPGPETLGTFLSDRTPDAFERLVTSLLESPRYGEHQARYWLDAVRYGDTHGLHLDNRRGIFPYRDWVVRALNQNLPLNEFITWQVAGDLLPRPTIAQRVATGFVRMNPTTAEGGAIPAEFQAKNNFDRVETFGTVMLGMTMTCARCHTHKYDPITQTEYYRLLAFFNSTAESSMDGNRYAYAPVVDAPADQAAWDAWERLESRMSALARDIDDAGPLVAYAEAARRWSSDGWAISKRVPSDADAPTDEEMAPVTGLPGTKRKLALKENEAVWITCSLTTPVDQTLDLVLGGTAGSRAWLDGKPVPVSKLVKQSRRKQVHTLSLTQGRHALRLKIVGAKKAIPVAVRAESPWHLLAQGKAWEDRDLEQRVRMIADPLGPFAGDERQRRAADLAQAAFDARNRFTTTLVAQDLPKPRVTRVLQRGEYDLPTGNPLEPDVPGFMNAFPDGAPRNRLGLAQWLTGRENPLVARVMINRIWQRVFGSGLVRTPEDFGLQGRQPTHPELLDWLAVELQDSGWDMKHMLRLMVTSQTFRQRSVWRTDIDDPENLWLARGPRHRLDAEVVRDVALFASGLLDPHMGGAGVKPYQPKGLWSALAHPASNTKKYVQDGRDKLYRRSLYIYWKRTSPHPMMILFDAPSREASCVARSRTNTPLQSLALLNETQRLEMSRAFAQRLLLERSDDAARLDLLWTLLACREPTARERKACTTLLMRMRARYADKKDEAVSLLDRSGLAPRDASVDPVELAAWSQTVITVMASDVAIMLF